MEHADILIVGAGAAGIAAAKGTYRAGCRRIALVDRRDAMGGVLLQCAHRGFGGGMTGPEYIGFLLEDFPKEAVFHPGTTVLSVSQDRTAALSGGETVRFSQLVLAAGCLEIPMGALPIAGTRPKGVYTAGQMQEMVHLHGFRPEGPVVILGSGDLGLIMAGHLAEQGLSVTLVERKGAARGMARNRRCLREFPIRLVCHCSVTRVLGERRLTGVMLSDGESVPCRTLLIAVGLRPDRELVRGLENRAWVHLCGNCNAVHPMIETVIHEGEQAGCAAWENIRGSL